MTDSVQAAATLLALSILPLIRRHGYEAFLILHRTLVITLYVALWQHLGPRQSLSRILMEASLGALLAAIAIRIVIQVYRNSTWLNSKIQIAHTSKARRCGDTLIVRIELARPWNIQPGNFIYIRLLTLNCASLFQSHPFVITWWDNMNEPIADPERIQSKESDFRSEHEDRARVLYAMVDPRRGWTRRVMGSHHIFDNRTAWLDGPHGRAYRLERYSTTMLFASNSGIFAQLPLLKGLLSALRGSPSRTKRLKLIWQTDTYHEQLQEWMHEILRGDELDKNVSNQKSDWCSTLMLIRTDFGYMHS